MPCWCGAHKEVRERTVPKTTSSANGLTIVSSHNGDPLARGVSELVGERAECDKLEREIVRKSPTNKARVLPFGE